MWGIPTSPMGTISKWLGLLSLGMVVAANQPSLVLLLSITTWCVAYSATYEPIGRKNSS
jgi:hypothetical protein